MLNCSILTFFHTEIEFKYTGKKFSFWLICGNINLQINTVYSILAIFFKPSEFAFMVPIISRWQDMVLKSMGKYC